MKATTSTKNNLEQRSYLIQYLWEVCKCIGYITKENVLNTWLSIRRILSLSVILILSLLSSSSAQAQECRPYVLQVSEPYLSSNDSTLNDTLWYDVHVRNQLAFETLNSIDIVIDHGYPGSTLDTTINVVWACFTAYVGTFYVLAAPYDYEFDVKASATLSDPYGTYESTYNYTVQHEYTSFPQVLLDLNHSVNLFGNFGTASNGTLTVENPFNSASDLANFELNISDGNSNRIYSADFPIAMNDTLAPGESLTYDFEFYAASGSQEFSYSVKADILNLDLPDGSPFWIYEEKTFSHFSSPASYSWDVELLNDPMTVNIGDTVFGTIYVDNDISGFILDSLFIEGFYDIDIDNDSLDFHNLDTLVVNANSILATGASLAYDFWFIPNTISEAFTISLHTQFVDAFGLQSYAHLISDELSISHLSFIDLELDLDIADLNFCWGDSLNIDDGYIVNTGTTDLTDIKLTIDECWTGTCNDYIISFPQILEPGDTLNINPCSMLPLLGQSSFSPKLSFTPVNASMQVLEELRSSRTMYDITYTMTTDPEVEFTGSYINFNPSAVTPDDPNINIELGLKNTGCAALSNVHIYSDLITGLIEYDTLMYDSSAFQIGDSIGMTVSTNLPAWNDPLYLDSTYLANNNIEVFFDTTTIAGQDTLLLSSVVLEVSFYGNAQLYYPDIPYACTTVIPFTPLCVNCPSICLNPPCLNILPLFSFSLAVNSAGAGGGGSGSGGSSGGGGSGPMPVELISFIGSAESDYNLLEWSVASEIENDYYTLSRSPDGVDFYEIRKEYGAGTISRLLNYEFKDSELTEGLVYYKLEQTDFDGTNVELGLIALEREGYIPSSEISISPVPAEDFIHVDYANKVYNLLYIIDSSGKTLKVITKSRVDISDLEPGIYFIKAETNKGSLVKKFIKD